MHNLYLMLDTTMSAVQEKQDMGSTSKTKGKLTSPTKRHYRAHMAKQRKRIQGLRQALNMKKKQQNVSRKSALDALRTMLPERMVKFIDVQIDLHSKKKQREKIHTRNKVFCSFIVSHKWQGIQVAFKIFQLTF